RRRRKPQGRDPGRDVDHALRSGRAHADHLHGARPRTDPWCLRARDGGPHALALVLLRPRARPRDGPAAPGPRRAPALPGPDRRRRRGPNPAVPRPTAVLARGTARTFQSIRLFQNMTVLENALVGEHCRLAATVPGAVLRPPAVIAEEARAHARARELLEFVGLGGKEHE